jgi:putative membrane protein
LIVRRNLRAVRVLSHDRLPVVYATGVAVVVTAAHDLLDVHHLALPFAPIATFGAAVSIFAAFRINVANARWTEARVQWATIQNSCRVLIRQLTAATTSSVRSAGATPAEAASYCAEIAQRLIAFAYTLGTRLRGTNPAVDKSLPDDAELRDAVNPANLLLQSISVQVKDGVSTGLIGQFDPIMLEPSLGALNGAATACERIKHTPTPRQYDYFTRLAVIAFSTLLPFGLLSALPPGDVWWTVPLTAIIAGVFIVLERLGSVLDAPFENTISDVPITFICREIERDLFEQLGDHELPDPVSAVDGYLW